jgi:hypothetical protein
MRRSLSSSSSLDEPLEYGHLMSLRTGQKVVYHVNPRWRR